MKRFWLKSHFFIAYAVLGAYAPYMALHSKDIGMSDQQLGTLLGVGALSAIITPPVLTYLADSFFSNRTLLGISYALAASFLSLMAFTQDIWIFSLAYAAYSISYGGTLPLLDGLTFAMFEDVESTGKQHQPYHLYRIWGSIGFIAPAAVVAAILYYTHTNRDAFLIGVALAVMGLLTVPMLPRPQHQIKLPTRNRPTLEAAKILLKPQMLTFIISMFLMTMASSSLYAFYPQQIEKLGMPKQWVGLAMSIGIVVELPFVLYSGKIVKWIGVRNVMLIGASCMIGRYALLAFSPLLMVALGTQLFHGPIVLAMYVLPQMFINQKADSRCRNSIQGLYIMICSGVARLIGSSLAGYYADIELRYSFIYSTVLASLATLILFVMFRDTSTDQTMQATLGQTIETDYPEQ